MLKKKKKTQESDSGMGSMVEGTPLLSFHVQQTIPYNIGLVEADVVPENNKLTNLF